MSSVAERKFMEEMASLVQKNVTVVTTSGKAYNGILSGINAVTMSICLSQAKDESGTVMHKLFLNGHSILQLYSAERPFDLQSLADRLERVFPKMVRTVDEAGVIVVMDKIRLTEKGIIEGSGPAAERVQKVYEEFIRDKGKA